MALKREFRSAPHEGSPLSAVLRPTLAAWHRPMLVRDLDLVLPLEVAAYSHPWTRGNFIDSLASGYTAELRLDGCGRLVGYFVALPSFEETHLLNLSVAPALQRAGHGQAMLQRLLAHSRQRGDQALWLEVRPSNLPALALYQGAGFVQVGCRRSYYPAEGMQREDALVMRLALDRPMPAPGAASGPGSEAGAADALV